MWKYKSLHMNKIQQVEPSWSCRSARKYLYFREYMTRRFVLNDGITKRHTSGKCINASPLVEKTKRKEKPFPQNAVGRYDATLSFLQL